MSHPNNPDQPKIEGFSRLLIQETDVGKDATYPTPKHSGSYISKDKHWLIAPSDTHHVCFQLLPISPEAGRLFYKVCDSITGPLSDIIFFYNKHFKQEII